MTIEEIKKKYKGEAATREQAISEARRKRDMQQAVVEYLTAEREKLRPKTGVMDHDSRQQWTNLTFRIAEAKAKLNQLETEYDNARSNIDIDHAIELMQHQ